MSENTHKNQEYAEVCIGQMIATEKGLEMPPQYAYRIDFKSDDVMVIPLVSDEKKQEKPRQARNQKSVPTKTRRATSKVEEGREEA